MAGVTTRSVTVVVRGKVQGVGFRWFMRERGRELRLAGWVRNLPDGAVEFVARGPAADVDALIKSASTGPRGASVTGVQVDELTTPGDLPLPFDIRRGEL